jgi:D-tyrosyl-tRNA(Tyr) deacylase
VVDVRAVIQRVRKASVSVGEKTVGEIGRGLAVLVGVAKDDTAEDAGYLADKIASLRIFEDEHGKMNRSVQDIDGEVLIVSQFTLMGDARRGRRPSFTLAASPELAESLYETFVDMCRQKIGRVETGQFQTEMLVSIINDGPVTILLDSKKLF